MGESEFSSSQSGDKMRFIKLIKVFVRVQGELCVAISY